MKRLFTSAFLLFAGLITPVLLYAEEQSNLVIYPKPSGQADVREAYFFELLNLALDKSSKKFGDYSLSYSDIEIPSSRIPMEVRRNRFVNILTSPSSKELESLMLPIKLPLVKGIQGLRLLLINKGRQQNFSSVTQFNQLKKFSYGHGTGWLDALVFNNAGLPITTSTEYNGLFKMLDADRFDAFPRGLNEIYREFSARAKAYPNMQVENNIVIYYDLPVYFFVSKTNQHLHDRVAFGLNQAILDGSFDEHFFEFFGDAIAKANLEKRQFFYLSNPYVTPVNKAQQAKFWLPFILRKLEVVKLPNDRATDAGNLPAINALYSF